jgi:NADPH:quinone reductase-like Zn-dependent oxidoreductase
MAKLSVIISVTSGGIVEVVKRFSDEVIIARDFTKYVRDADVVMELVGSETINEGLRALPREETLIKRPVLTIMREHRIVGSAAHTRKRLTKR